MKLNYILTVGALACGLAGIPAIGAPNPDDPVKKNQSIGQDLKDAGKDTGRAAKKSGRKVKNGSKKAVNKTAEGTEKGADKVRQKTEP
jgi:hypothetical protein